MKRRGRSICSLLLLYLLANRSFAEELTLNVNFRQPIAVTDEKFLSLTLDPAALFHGSALSTDFEKSVNLAKALSPAYIRLGGEHGTFYQSADPDSRSVEENENHALTESEWVAAHNWAEKAGLNVIACIAPETILRKEQRDSESLEDAGNIVSFSNHMGFNTSWQLGYECQNRCNISGTELASQLVILRKVLDEFPRYSSSLIVGPDVAGYKTDEQRQYLRDYFSIAAPALSAITWHPDLDSVILDNEGVLIREDTLDKDKEELFRVIGRFSKKKPLWIAESKPEECKNLYLGALVLARRLGNAAKLKVNVVMRQPTDLTQPTPDYWVSLLHKTLVGREVFEARVQSLNKSHVYLYCQCTRASNRYQRGSVTIFGVNLSPENVRVDLKGAKITTLHEYILSPGFDAPNRMFAESVLLNNESLSLVNDTVPDLEPAVLYDTKGLELDLQSGGIGFWVLPGLRIKACMEVRESAELQTSRSSAQNSQGLRKKIDDPKARLTRSTRDGETTKAERKREGREGNTSRVTRKLDARKELRRLKRFVKRKLSDYDARKSIVEDSFDSKATNRAIRQSKTDELSEQSSQGDMNAKLEDFKNRLSRFGNLEDPLGAAVAKAMALMFNVQNAFEKEKSETDGTSKGLSSGAVRTYLQLLLDVLTNVTLPGLSDTLESRESNDQRTKRARRDLLKTEPATRDLLKTEPSFSLKRESLLQRRSRLENAGDQRDQALIKREDFRVRPRVVQLGTSDSGERTFYGFFKTEPVEGFPEGDVFFRADVRRGSDDDYQTVGYHGSHHDDPEDNDSEGDNPESPEAVEDPSEPDGHVTSGDFWDIETIERRRNAKQATQKESRVKRVPGKAKLVHQGPKMRDLNEESVSKDTDLPTDLELFRSKRSRRDPDLRAILDQEMVKEDDANSKDCKCRVIRSKRQSPGSVEQETIDRVSEADATDDPNPEELETHDVGDVEVFSDIEGSPMEILQAQTEASNVKERNAEMNLFKVGEPLQDEAKLSPEEIEASNSGDTSSDSPLNSPAELENSTPARLSRESAISGLTETSGLNAESQSLATLVNEDGTFFRGESGRSKEERAAVNTFGTAAEYPSSSRESLATKEDGTQVKEAKEVSGAEASDATLGSSLPGAEAPSATLGSTLPGAEASGAILGSSLSGAGIARAAIARAGIAGAEASEPSLESTLPGVEAPSATIGSTLPRAKAAGATLGSSLSGAGIAGAEASDPSLESTLPGVEAPSAALGSTLPGAEASGPTLKSALLEKGIAGAEDDYYNNKVARGSLKRHAVSQEPILQIRGVESGESVVSGLSESRRNRRRERTASRKKPTSETKPLEGRLFENMKLLMTLKKMLDERKGQVKDSIRLGSAGGNRENRRNRLDQFQKLRSLLRDRRQRLQSVSRDEAEDDAEEEMRTLKRREALEVIEENGDREGSGFEVIEPDTTGKSMEKGELSVTEIVRPRNVRERILNLKHSANFHDQAIMEHSNPSDLAEIIELKNLYENEGARGERSSEDKEEEGRSYFALVEDLENPRIFHYHKPQQQKRSTQVSPLFRVSEYIPRYKTYRKSIEVIQDPNEETEADELPQDQEIYVIDPSTYRGGQPTLQLYRDPSNLRKPDPILIADEYEPIFKPILYKSYRIRQAEPHKREDSEAINVQRQSDQGAQLTELQDSPRDLNVNELLRILINSLDLRTAEELFERLTGGSTASVGKQNLVRSISEESGEEQSSEDGGEREEDEQGQEEQRASGISDARVKEKRESYQRPSMRIETSEDDTDSGASVAPEDDGSPEGYFNAGGVTEVRKRRDTDQSEVLRLLPWAKKLDRHRRQTVDQATVEESVEKMQPLKLQQLEEVSSPRIPTYIDDVEKSIVQKRPVEMHTEQQLAYYINERRRLRKNNENLGFSSFLQGSIPRLQNVVVDGLKKAQGMTNSMEQLIENVNELNETSESSEERDSVDSGSPNATQNTFHNAIMQVKKFFMFLSGIAHILHG